MPARSSVSPRIVSRVRASRSTDRTRGAKRGRHVAVVVVIAEHRVHTVRGRQRRQRFGGRDDEMPVAPGDVVAAEHHEIGRFASSAVVTARAISSCGTVSLRWTSVMRPMRSPESAAGSPETCSVSRVSPR